MGEAHRDGHTAEFDIAGADAVNAITNRIFCGDALTELKKLPEESVNCCVTSPPYYGLRDYGCDGQIGLEETPELYIQRLKDVFAEVRRVLKSDGTLWLNIGDSYAGSGKGAATHPENAAKYNQGTSRGMLGAGGTAKLSMPSGCKPKDLIGVPWLLAFALRDDGWYLRQDIIWQKPNPMPESVTDRCTKSHEYIFLLSKSASYYYNADAIKEPTVTQGLEHRENPARFGGKKYTSSPDEFSRTKSGNAYPRTQQVAKCGNAVCPPLATAMVRANLPEWCYKVDIYTMAELRERVAI